MVMFNYRLLFLNPSVLYSYPDTMVNKSLMISSYCCGLFTISETSLNHTVQSLFVCLMFAGTRVLGNLFNGTFTIFCFVYEKFWIQIPVRIQGVTWIGVSANKYLPQFSARTPPTITFPLIYYSPLDAWSLFYLTTSVCHRCYSAARVDGRGYVSTINYPVSCKKNNDPIETEL
jgi:hypothetical protein